MGLLGIPSVASVSFLGSDGFPCLPFKAFLRVPILFVKGEFIGEI